MASCQRTKRPYKTRTIEGKDETMTERTGMTAKLSDIYFRFMNMASPSSSGSKKLTKRKAMQEEPEVESKQQILSGQESCSKEASSQEFVLSESSELNSSDFPPRRTSDWDSAADYFDAMGLRIVLENEDDLDYFVRRHVYAAIGKLHPSEIPHADTFFTIQSSSSGREIEDKLRAAFDVINLNITDLQKCATDKNVFKRVFKQIERMEESILNWYKQCFCNVNVGGEAGKISEETCVFFRKFVVSGKDFTSKLKKIVCRMNKKGQLPVEAEYQILFSFFLNMFNLETSVCPDVECRQLKITGYDEKKDSIQCCITSTPDILISHTDFMKREDQILAVIKANREYSRDEILSGHHSRRQERPSQVTHVGSKIIGQHTGELLVHMSSSVFSDHGIIGMILQATEVSFTFLNPGTHYLRFLQNGFYSGRRQAALNINIPVDFLTVEGRDKLIGPLLRLFFLQKWSTQSNTST